MAAITMRRPQALLVACVLSMFDARVAAGETTLYDRIGGEPVLSRVVSDLIDHAAMDPRTRRSFLGSNLPRIKTLVTEQLCELTGGACRYSGDSMREVHAGQRISQGEFFAFTELLQDALRRAGVGLSARNELISCLAPMEREIVERPSAGHGAP